ncbi:hypothetical protein L3X38_019243 [Prunus dulcis]|uniref:Uncharacterized protein n=1 Tax=Prunus dulcis TaxID=3755 RepID=A0AAD4ZBV4_PRUDU|nr:hypothetical protein L3X38_019243 [Prunus dulcis]
MSSIEVQGNKPHAVCIPFPIQSHIKAMLKLAKLLHHRGFHITFVNTEFNHRRFLKSLGPHSLDGLPDFQFETIPDGIPASDEDAGQNAYLLCDSIRKNFLAVFRNLLLKLNDMETSNNSSNPPVTCIVSDGFMTFSITAAEELGIPVALFFTIAAIGFMGFKQYPTLVEKGLAPLKEESYLTNGFLDQVIDWVPVTKAIRLKDLPNYFQTTNPNDILFKLTLEAMDRVDKASAVVLHTFDELEADVLHALSSLPPPVYTIGPLQFLLNQIPQHPLKSMGYSLWKEETAWFQWLNAKVPNSVVYVNFGSIVVIKSEDLIEFCWGLANSKLPFFWVVRPDLLVGESAILPPEFVAETKGRGLVASWCPQEQVLSHPSIGGFLTHSGWNSTIESLSAGVPMLCWPFFAEQRINCVYTCNEWGIGLEINNDAKRDQVEKLIKELMEGEKGKKMKTKAMEWKKLAEKAISPDVPLQSHIKAMLKLAKLFHHRGFHVTFVNTEFNHKRFLQSLGPNSLDGLPDFRFETFPDGLPVKRNDRAASSNTNPPVTCIVSDGLMPFPITAAEKLGIPNAMIFTISAGGFMGSKQFPALVEKGLTPLKDESYFTNGFLDKVIDWIPGMKGIHLRELLTVFRITNPDNIFFKLTVETMDRVDKASAVVLLTFDALEQEILDALSSMLIPPIYTIGPIELLLVNQIPEDPLNLAVMTPELLVEFGWVLANTNYPFLWVIRPDFIVGESAIFAPEFVAETKGRGVIVNWCPREQVLNHPSVGGGFLTHSGWNSTIESLSAGVPMIRSAYDMR